MSAVQFRTRDLVLIAIFILLLVILFWPSGDDESEVEANPEDLAIVESPTPEPTSTPTQPQERSCKPGDAARVLNRWVAALNNADLDRLAEMLPDRGASTPTTVSFPGMDRTILHSFRVHESGAMSQPIDVLDYLETRVDDQHEHWRIDDVDLYRMGRNLEGEIELDRATVRFTRTADDLPDHELEGTIILNCFDQQVLLVELTTDLAELALPIPVDQFLGAVGPYGAGEMRDLRMIISTDIREDTGTLMQWDVRRLEANDMSGNYVEAIKVETLNGNPIIDYIYSQPLWYLNQRGWEEIGDLTGWSVLPLEIMLTRTEPSITANILRDHLEEIPEEGVATITGAFEIRPELQEAAELRSLPETIEGIIEVNVEDGNVSSTRYRLVDQVSGAEMIVPDIRWLHIVRRERFDPGAFLRPPGVHRDEQQYVPSAALGDQIRLIERLDHDEGIGERFALEWDGESYDVLVMPSRGRSHEHSRGDDWPVNWERVTMLAGGHQVVLGGPAESRFPQAAIWDTRQFRYELQIDPDSFRNPDMLGVQTVTAIVEALVGAEPSQDGLRWLGP